MKSLGQIVEAIAPRFAYNRFTAREQLKMARTGANGRDPAPSSHSGKFYAGANPGINRSMANQISSPEDYRQAYERIVLWRYARQMEEDIPYVESILSDFETYVVGDLRYRANTGNEEADAVINEHLEFRFAEVDLARENDLTDMAKLAVRTKKREGECGFAYVDIDEAELRVQMIGSDRIGNPFLTANADQYNFNGIRVDPTTGQVVEYDIWRRLPKVNAYVFDRTVPANYFVHFREKFRIDQYHGVTAFRTAITRSVDIEQAVQFTIQNIKFRSSQLPSVQNEQGRPKVPGSGYTPVAANVNNVPQPYQIQVDGVTQNFLKIGEGYVEFPHDFPNANFVDVKDDLKGDIAVGVHLPGEFCFRSKAGGVLQRFYIEKAQRTFDEEKRQLRKQFLQPLKNRILRRDVDSGVLNLDRFPGLAGSLNLYRGAWHMGRSVTTDYGKDTDSDIKLIESGLMSPDEHLADNARDRAEIRQSRRKQVIEAFEDAQEIAAKTGRPFGEVLPYFLKIYPNPILGEKATDANAADITQAGTDPIPETPPDQILSA